MNFTKAGLLAAALMFGGQAVADSQPSYNFVSGGYSNWDTASNHDEPDGLTLAGSFLLTDNFFMGLDFYLVESTNRESGFFGDSRLDEEIMVLNLKGGLRVPINHGGDFVASLGYLRFDFDIDGQLTDPDGNVSTFSGSGDTDGFSLAAGIRQMLTPDFEVSFLLDHWDLEATDTALVLGANYDFTRNLGVGGSLRTGGDIDIFNLALRYRF